MKWAVLPLLPCHINMSKLYLWRGDLDCKEGRTISFEYIFGGETGRGRRSKPWLQLYLRRGGLGGEECRHLGFNKTLGGKAWAGKKTETSVATIPWEGKKVDTFVVHNNTLGGEAWAGKKAETLASTALYWS